MDLSAQQPEQHHANTRKDTTREATKSSERKRNGGSGFERHISGMKQQEVNIPFKFQVKAPPRYENRSFHEQGQNLLENTRNKADQEEDEQKTSSACQGTNNTNMGLNSSDPQPLDLNAIIRKYNRKKEAATRMRSSDMKKTMGEQSNQDITAKEVPGTFRDGESATSNQKKAVSTGHEVEAEKEEHETTTGRREMNSGKPVANSSEPLPLDLKAIIKEYDRRKEEASRMRFAKSNEAKGEQRNRDATESAVARGANSFASAQKKHVVSPATESQQSKKQHPAACKPKDIDVLLGRGRAYRNHPGNIKMKQLVKRHREEYDAALYREDKTNLSWMIVLDIKGEGGRFLKKNKTCGNWFEVSQEIAREKISHAMRDSRKKRGSAPSTDPPRLTSIAAGLVPTGVSNAVELDLSSLHQQQRQPPAPTSFLSRK